MDRSRKSRYPTDWVWAGCLALTLVLAGRSSPSIAETLTVTSSIEVGTCDVTLGGQNAQTITIADINPSTLSNGGVGGMGVDTRVNLALTCLGVSGADAGGTIPTLTLGGTPVSGSGAAAYLFQSNSGTADPRVGVVLSTAAPSGTGTDGWSDGDYLKPMQQWQPWIAGNGQGLKTTLYAGLSCGDAVSCNIANGPLAPGNLTTAITFDFLYK